MENVVQVMVKTVYGEPRFYPVNGPAKTFAEMVNQETLTRRDFKFIRELGYEVQAIKEEIEL